jgi:hypothetical protein
MSFCLICVSTYFNMSDFSGGAGIAAWLNRMAYGAESVVKATTLAVEQVRLKTWTG